MMRREEDGDLRGEERERGGGGREREIRNRVNPRN